MLVISKKVVYNTLKMTVNGMIREKPRRRAHNKTPSNIYQSVINHTKSFPRIESHYCRPATKREYLDSSLSLPASLPACLPASVPPSHIVAHTLCQRLWIFVHDLCRRASITEALVLRRMSQGVTGRSRLGGCHRNRVIENELIRGS